MNVRASWMRWMGFSLLVAVAGLMWAGCKTTPKVDWNSRIGTYTYDQAVVELGPPDKMAKLTDGKTVADWVVGQGGGSAFSVGTGFWGAPVGVGVGQTIGSAPHLKILRLTFDSENKLFAWSKNY